MSCYFCLVTTKHKDPVDRYIYIFFPPEITSICDWSKYQFAISFPGPLFACLLMVIGAAAWMHLRESLVIPFSSPNLIVLALLNKLTLELAPVSATLVPLSLLLFVYLLSVWLVACSVWQQLSSGHLKPVQNLPKIRLQTSPNQSKTSSIPKLNLPLPNTMQDLSILTG